MDMNLEERLAAAQRTIAALMRRVEKQVTSGETAFAALQQNSALEQVVAERTRELEARRQDLQETLANLRRTQSELLQAQKLESVGRLAAGIAHEINTPVQFVNDNVHFLQEAFRDLVGLLEKHRQLRTAAVTGQASAELLREVDEAESAADLGYLLENVPKALARSIEGVERVASIVRSLKEFAHPEGKGRAQADLNRALASTLTIARNEYKYLAEVETDYGELPPVSCFVGQLNQVFLNVIVNAAHAIEEALQGKGQLGLIRVETRREGDSVRISISDTGTGMSREVQEHVFDPFFTTKAVGKGTGQGLAISRSVVADKHGGTLTFDSEVGRGTTFHIRIPISSTAE